MKKILFNKKKKIKNYIKKNNKKKWKFKHKKKK